MFDYIDKQCSNLYTYLTEIKVCFEIKKKFLTKYLYDKFTMQISKIRNKFSPILEYQYIFKSKKKDSFEKLTKSTLPIAAKQSQKEKTGYEKGEGENTRPPRAAENESVSCVLLHCNAL